MPLLGNNPIGAVENIRFVEAFAPHVPKEAEFAPPADLEMALRKRLEAARAAWPSLEIPAAVFMRCLAERTEKALVPEERAADLYLACGCALGSPAATQAFLDTFRSDIERIAQRIHPAAAFAEDLEQLVSERLFVSEPGAAPRIAEYAGRSSLRGWVGVVVKRTALNMRRNKDDRDKAALPSEPGALGVMAGPETELLRARYKDEFEGAIRIALSKLPDKDRTMLLLHLVDGMTLPQLATLQNVSRATVVRWLSSARAALREATERELGRRTQLSPSELVSVTALVRSHLDLSVTELVRADPRVARQSGRD